MVFFSLRELNLFFFFVRDLLWEVVVHLGCSTCIMGVGFAFYSVV